MIQELQSARLDLYLDQGDTYYKTFTVKDDSGAVLDLTGFSIESTMTRYLGTKHEYYLLATITNPLTGSIALTMSEMASRALTEGRYVYSVRLRNETVAVKIMEGQVIVSNTALSPIQVTLTLSGNQVLGEAGFGA